jgi:hypothetical protein
VRLEPLYHVRFSYGIRRYRGLPSPRPNSPKFFFLAEGRCEGRVAGRFIGANHPHRRSDGTFLPDFQGVIETDDGAEVLFDYRGYGRAYPAGKRQVVMSATHLSEHERYRWLNDSLSVGAGEVRSQKGGPTELVLDLAEVVWEPMEE